MTCKDYLNAIVENNGDMEELGNIMCDCISMLSPSNRKEIESRMYVLAYGERINEDMAIESVEAMQPYGEHWSMEQTTQVGNSYGYDEFSKCSWYWTMNMMYNDYHSIIGDDTNMYIKMSKAFLLDEDAPDGDIKVYRYIQAMK